MKLELNNGVTIQGKAGKVMKQNLITALKHRFKKDSSALIFDLSEQCEATDGKIYNEHNLVRDESCGCKRYYCTRCGRKYIP